MVSHQIFQLSSGSMKHIVFHSLTCKIYLRIHTRAYSVEGNTVHVYATNHR